MNEIKDFRADKAGVWIPRWELMKIRNDENTNPSIRLLADDLIYQIDKHVPVPMDSMDPERQKLAGELQRRLMQCTIDFFREKGIEDIWSVGWDADDLMSSVKEGKWAPYSDSSITLECLTSDGRIPVAFVI